MLANIAAKSGLRRDQICMVGDRLDTDIQFGNDGGLTTLLVLSGEAPPLLPCSACPDSVNRPSLAWLWSLSLHCVSKVRHGSCAASSAWLNSRTRCCRRDHGGGAPQPREYSAPEPVHRPAAGRAGHQGRGGSMIVCSAEAKSGHADRQAVTASVCMCSWIAGSSTYKLRVATLVHCLICVAFTNRFLLIGEDAGSRRKGSVI